MKTIVSSICVFLFTTCSTFGQTTIGDPPPPTGQSFITGSWIHMEDAKSKWTFTESPDIVRQYYDEELTNKYIFTIHSSLPDCGIEWDNPDPNLKFLVIEEEGSNNKKCFTVYGLTENYLTISPFEVGGIIRFEKE